MGVNGDERHGAGPRRRRQVDRSAVTRAALLGAAQRRFAAHGFARTAREDIVRDAGVTRGALYHHFGSKEALFRAVFEAMERDLTARVAAAAARGATPGAELALGCDAFLDAATDPAVQRVILIDAPAVLGWQTWREIDARHGLGLLAAGLTHAMDAGTIERQPVTPLAHVLLAALNEAALYIAGADDPAGARAEVGVVLTGLLTRL